MNEIIKTFNNPEFGEVRTLTIDGEPWFVGKDVAEKLGYANQNRDIVRHVDEEDRIMTGAETQYQNGIELGQRGGWLINESGLYSLILSSKLPNAKAFKRWITSEVIPSIRKHGTYIMNDRKPDSSADKRANAMMLNAKSRIAKQMMDLWTAAGVEPQYQALALNGYYDGLEIPRIALKATADALLDQTTIADHLGILSKSGKPHAQAVGAIISQLGLSEDEYTETPYSRNGHDGVAIQYTELVENKVRNWLVENDYPTTIPAGDKNYSVRYRPNAREEDL